MSVTVRKRGAWEIQRAVLFALLMRELKTRFGRRLVGMFWVLLEPIVQSFSMLFIRTVLKVSLIGPTLQYAVYIICAMIPYFVFRNCWNRTLDAVNGNLGLFAYRQVKPMDAILARCALENIIYAGVFVLVMGTLWWFGYKFKPDDPIMFITCWVFNVLIGLGIGEICLVLAHGRPAVRTIIGLTGTPLYLLSGVLVPFSGFTPAVVHVLLFNPVANLVELERVAYFHEYIPSNEVSLRYPVMCALVLLAVGHMMYRKNRMQLLQG